MKRSHDTLSAGVQRKRQKTRSARTIATESSSNSLQTGALPIQEFISSRRFEIKALADSIQKSREAGVQRAFQSLPRYLRRRAASHNVKKVPKRIRARAIAELSADDQKKQHKTVPFKRKRGRRSTLRKLALLQKQKQKAIPAQQESQSADDGFGSCTLLKVKPITNGKFANRQRNKTWLPSHLWTCKRAKMHTKWNYAIPISPNEKTYRSTHRASTSQGAIVFDTSYIGSMLMKGTADELCSLLRKITQSKSYSGLRARSGKRCQECLLFEKEQILCPVTLFWISTTNADDSTVVIRIHAATFMSVWQLCLTLRKDMKLDTIKCHDLRFQIGSIEVFGPDAVDAVLSVLKVSEETEIATAWKSLHGCAPDEIYPRLMIPLIIKDPRLTFPHRFVTKPRKVDKMSLEDWQKIQCEFPLFVVETLEGCNSSKPLATETSKQEARDVPVLILPSEQGLSLMAPWAYITDIWYSLNHLAVVRFGGLNELAQIRHEKGVPFFPTDYPGTLAGDTYAEQMRDERKAKYDRTPPAKRTNYKKSLNGKPEVGDPFTCDFDYLVNPQASIGGSGNVSTLSHISASILDQSTKPVDDMTMDVIMAESSANISAVPLYTSTPQLPEMPKQSISQGGSAALVVGTLTSNGDKLKPTCPILLEPSRLSMTVEETIARGFVQVRIRMDKQGCPKTCARIYSRQKERGGERELIGYLTTGNFNIKAGRGTGLGSILATVVLEAQKKAESKRNKQHNKWVRISGQCSVRDVGTENFREASWELPILK